MNKLRQHLNAKAQASVIPLHYFEQDENDDKSTTAEQEDVIDHGWAGTGSNGFHTNTDGN